MKNRIYDVLAQTPGLKGRQIAKEIGEEKTTVNSFLSNNKDSFRKDDRHCWFNSCDGIVIEFQSGWVDGLNFEYIFARHLDLFTVEGSIKFVIPKGCSLLLVSIAKFLALVNQLKHQGIDVTIDLTSCAETRSFLNRAGFFDHLERAITVLPKRPKCSTAVSYKGKSETLVEFGSIDPNSENKPLIVRLLKTFISKSNASFTAAASTVFSEMIGNVGEHSESEIEGFAALQSYTPHFKKQHIQTVISDSGLGVIATLRKTLGKNYPVIERKYKDSGIDSDIGLVLEVFSTGQISRYGVGRGLGFQSSREQAVKFDADLSIRQETFNILLEYRGGLLVRKRINKDLTRLKGTHICFDFYVD